MEDTPHTRNHVDWCWDCDARHRQVPSGHKHPKRFSVRRKKLEAYWRKEKEGSK